MKERGILFSGSMPQALREGRKTQTRRPITRLLKHGEITEFGKSDTRGYDWHFRDRQALWNDLRHAQLLERCPYGQPGDRLWVRENFSLQPTQYDFEKWVVYQSDGMAHKAGMAEDETAHYRPADPKMLEDWTPRLWAGREIKRWNPSIHMPRWASRFTLEITGVRVEQLWEITDEDCEAEGVRPSLDPLACDWLPDETGWRRSFRHLWSSINSPGSWALNPWVWAIEFNLSEGGLQS